MCLKGISEKIAILEKNMLTLLFKHGLHFEPRIVFRAENLDVEANPSANPLQVPSKELVIQHLEIECSHVPGFHRSLQITIQRELHFGSSLHRQKEISSY